MLRWATKSPHHAMAFALVSGLILALIFLFAWRDYWGLAAGFTGLLFGYLILFLAKNIDDKTDGIANTSHSAEVTSKAIARHLGVVVPGEPYSQTASPPEGSAGDAPRSGGDEAVLTVPLIRGTSTEETPFDSAVRNVLFRIWGDSRGPHLGDQLMERLPRESAPTDPSAIPQSKIEIRLNPLSGRLYFQLVCPYGSPTVELRDVRTR